MWHAEKLHNGELMSVDVDHPTRGGVAVPDAVRAHAFITLGKLCLRDASLARSQMNVLVRALQEASSPVVRSNVLLVLADLASANANVIDRHLPTMAASLADER